jgi:hypothetical protein
MSTVTIGVTSPGDTQRRVSAAFRGKKQGARISFALRRSSLEDADAQTVRSSNSWPARGRWLSAN